MASPNHFQIRMPEENVDQNQHNISAIPEVEEAVDYSQRAQWLRAAVLGANDGLVSVASLMMGVGAIKDEVKVMILTFFGGLFASAFNLAIGEFVSVLDIEVARSKRERRMAEVSRLNEQDMVEGKLPDPFQAAMASALAFSLGASMPLLAAAYITEYNTSLVAAAVVVAATTTALVVFVGIGAALGRSRVVWSCARLLVGGWMAMAITYGLTKLLSASGLEI